MRVRSAVILPSSAAFHEFFSPLCSPVWPGPRYLEIMLYKKIGRDTTRCRVAISLTSDQLIWKLKHLHLSAPGRQISHLHQLSCKASGILR